MTTPDCACLPATETKSAHRSYACPIHGCTCGTGRSSSLTHRGARDTSCPTHGTTPADETTRPPATPLLHPTELAEVDLRILALEKQVFKYQGQKEQRCAEVMGGRHAGAGTGSPVTRYYQRLNQLLDHPAATAAEPALIARLRAQREDH